MKYRQILYSNYHSTQSGRASLTDAVDLFNREVRQFENEIVPVLKNLPTTARIFDLGCGSGSLLMALKKLGYTNCLGMDLSEEQVNMAHDFGLDNVTLGDALAFLKTNNQPFDAIIGMDILEHFTKDELVELLPLIHQSLQEGGIAVFRTPNLDAPMATVFANGDFTHENYLNASSAQQVALACGFTTVQVLPSTMKVYPFWKDWIRKALYKYLVFTLKLKLFATARSTRNIVFSPNMILVLNR